MSERPKQGARRAFSRFDRRVGALAVLALGVLCILSLQLMRLSVVEHSVHRTNVERFLVTKRLLPAPRGRILDSMEVANGDELLSVLETVKRCVEAGELDAQIDAASNAVRARFVK